MVRDEAMRASIIMPTRQLRAVHISKNHRWQRENRRERKRWASGEMPTQSGPRAIVLQFEDFYWF